jgi:hypothetical protein
VAVERATAKVIAARRARVRVPRCVLHVSQRHARVERGRDEAVTARVRGDGLGDACLPREASNDLVGRVAVKP